jgi:hypothetical protein
MPYDLSLPVDISCLSALAEAGWLYQCSGTGVATGVTGACFALVNSGNKGLPIRLVSARVAASAAMLFTFGWAQSDPGLTAGNKAQNLRLGGPASTATFEQQVTTAPTLAGVLTVTELQVGGEVELLSPGAIYLPPGRALAGYSAAVAGTVALTLLWAEVENL